MILFFTLDGEHAKVLPLKLFLVAMETAFTEVAMLVLNFNVWFHHEQIQNYMIGKTDI